MTLPELQMDIKKWNAKHFPDEGAAHKVLGLVGEVGELAQAMKKLEAGVWGVCMADLEDALGDILVYCLALAAELDIDAEAALYATWEHVITRDGTGHLPDVAKKTGV